MTTTGTTYDNDTGRALALPGDGLVRLTHLIYLLHAISVFVGITSSAFIVTSFVSGLPSIVAVIINYVKRGDTRGTFLESHFRWQIRTFWFALLWIVSAGLLMLTVIGIPVAFALVVGAGLWVIYRILRGWLALKDRRPMRF
jgi:uncharacterized membrane protein